MASFKIAFVFLFAFGALECQSLSAVADPAPKSSNIVLAAQNAITIARNVIVAVDKGIEDSKPNLDIIVQQLVPEVGKSVRKVLENVRSLLKEEMERAEFVIEEVGQFLGAMNKIKSCTDQEKKNIERVLGNLENGLLDAYRKTKTNQAKSLEDMVAGFKRIVKNARAMFDSEITAFAECIKPKHPNAKKCFEAELEKVKKTIIAIAADVFLFSGEVKEVMTNFTSELIGRGRPVVEKFVKETDPVNKKISDCVAKLK